MALEPRSDYVPLAGFMTAACVCGEPEMERCFFNRTIFHHDSRRDLPTVQELPMHDLGRRCGYLPRQQKVEQEAPIHQTTQIPLKQQVQLCSLMYKRMAKCRFAITLTDSVCGKFKIQPPRTKFWLAR